MMKKTLISVLATTTVVCTACSHDNSTDSVPADQTVPAVTTAAAASGASGENLPGAMVGNTQRSWPDDVHFFDDSVHATPGTWSVDYLYQRPVWTPVNHDGDYPKYEDLTQGGFENCSGSTAVLTGKTTQQYINARYLAVNDQAGPTRLDNGVPAGFAHSPQGAIMLAINALSYGGPAQGDGVGEEIDKAWWSTYRTAQEERESKGLNKPTYDHTQDRAQAVPPPGFYHVTQCSENVVVVELGDDFSSGNIDSKVTTIPVYWRNGDWVPDLSGAAGDRADNQGTFDPTNPAPLHEVRYQ